MAPKIYVNGRFLTQRPTGVQRFALDFVLAVEAEYDLEILIPKSDVVIPLGIKSKVTVIEGGSGYFWEQITLPKFLKNNEGFLLNLCNTAPLLGKRNIVTIHDLAFENKHWVNWKFRWLYKFLVPKIAVKAQHIITVSETVKQQLSEQYKLNPAKISVIYNRVSEAFINASLKEVAGLGDKFYLTVGSLNPRKNYQWLSNFFADNDLPQLVIVGGEADQFKDANVNLKNCKVLGYTCLEELKWLYANAEAYINFSLYEGFGIPTIEAMSMGLPIVCSDIPINREIAGDEVVYVEPGDKSALKNQLEKIPSHPIEYKQFLKFQNFDAVKEFNTVVCGLQ